jgi:4-hydroxybenzoate polyprenyltransferase
VKKFLKLLRVKQYVKNFFIFLPIFFGLEFLHCKSLLDGVIAFTSFSMIASSIYIFNDIIDKEDDKRHKVKKRRPIASGEIAVKQGVFIMVILILLGLGVSLIFGNISVTAYLSIYLILNILYTLWLKRLPLIDVFVISLGYVIRVLVGGVVANVEINSWIIIMTFLLALFLGFAKRRDDVLLKIKENRSVRKSVDGYNLRFMDSVLFVSAAITLVSYIMYTVSPHTIALYGSKYIYITAVFVLLGIFRYLQISLALEKSGSPTEVLYKDRILQASILLWIISFGIIMYF